MNTLFVFGLLLAGNADTQTNAQTTAVPAAVLSNAMAPATMPPGYLTGKSPIDTLKLLPPPPAPGSAQDAADRAAYAASASTIGDANWARAISQLSPTGPDYMAQLSCVLGAKLSRETTPATYVLVARSGIDSFGPIGISKNFYKRPRPFTADAGKPGGGKACDPNSADGVGERLGWSYPSGHSAIGWLWALVLGDAAPARATDLRAFGMATGDLRVACRVHYLSDVASGRSLAAAIYARIAVEPEYQADVKRAAAELAAAPALVCRP